MSFLCTKALTLGGTKYYPGDSIPDNTIVPGRVAKLEKSGYISCVPEGSDSSRMQWYAVEGATDFANGYEGKIRIPVIGDGDEDAAELMDVALTEGETQLVFATMQMTVAQAEKQIEQIDSEDVLIVLHAADSRQGVKKAARKRADALFSVKQEKDVPSGYHELTGTTDGMDTQAG